MSRREFLAGLTSLVCLTSAGCLSRSREFNPNVDVKKQLGEASGISFEVEPDLDYEYLEESDEVRIYFEDGDSNTLPFETFGVLRAADHGSDRLAQILETNSVAGAGIGTGWGRVDLTEINTGPDEIDSLQEEFSQDLPWAPNVSHTHYYTRNRRLDTEPEVPFEEIVVVVPRSMEVTILFSEESYSVLLPIICKKSWHKDE